MHCTSEQTQQALSWLGNSPLELAASRSSHAGSAAARVFPRWHVGHKTVHKNAKDDLIILLKTLCPAHQRPWDAIAGSIPKQQDPLGAAVIGTFLVLKFLGHTDFRQTLCHRLPQHL